MPPTYDARYLSVYNWPFMVRFIHLDHNIVTMVFHLFIAAEWDSLVVSLREGAVADTTAVSNHVVAGNGACHVGLGVLTLGPASRNQKCDELHARV